MSATPIRRPASPNYVLALLMLAYMFSFLDRTLLSLMIDPIRASFRLSEVQVSLLLGFAFAIFYALLGLPCGRLADTRSRRNLIAAGIALWSLATVACGLAGGFWLLFVARMMVGVGEATLTPGAYSMIPDLFPPNRVGRAMALFIAGGSVGAGLALVLGGAVVDWARHLAVVLPLIGPIAGWQLTFLIVGAPGLLLALLFRVTVAEPTRHGTADEAAPSLRDVRGFLGEHRRVFALLGLGTAAVVGSNYSWILWGPSFFIRVHGLNAQQTGLVFGFLLGVVGIVSVIVGGLLSDRLVKRGYLDAPLRVYLLAIGASAPFLVGGLLVGNLIAALLLWTIGACLILLQGGMIGALLYQLCPGRLRGQISALYGILSTILGLGLAPTGTAYLTEHVFGGPRGVGHSIAASVALYDVVALVCLAAALPPVRLLARRNAVEGAA